MGRAYGERLIECALVMERIETPKCCASIVIIIQEARQLITQTTTLSMSMLLNFNRLPSAEEVKQRVNERFDNINKVVRLPLDKILYQIYF